MKHESVRLLFAVIEDSTVQLMQLLQLLYALSKVEGAKYPSEV